MSKEGDSYFYRKEEEEEEEGENVEEENHEEGEEEQRQWKSSFYRKKEKVAREPIKSENLDEIPELVLTQEDKQVFKQFLENLVDSGKDEEEPFYMKHRGKIIAGVGRRPDVGRIASDIDRTVCQVVHGGHGADVGYGIGPEDEVGGLCKRSLLYVRQGRHVRDVGLETRQRGIGGVPDRCHIKEILEASGEVSADGFIQS